MAPFNCFYMTQDRINDLREIRKLINILQVHGNVIVPSLPGENETLAQDRLKHFVDKLKGEGLDISDIEEGINLLPEYGF